MSPRIVALDPSAIPVPEADEILLDPAVLLRRRGEAWEIHPLDGAPGLPLWDTPLGRCVEALLAALPDGGHEDLGGPPPSHHAALHRAALPPAAQEAHDAASALNAERPTVRLQRRGPVGLVLDHRDTDAPARPVVLRRL